MDRRYKLEGIQNGYKPSLICAQGSHRFGWVVPAKRSRAVSVVLWEVSRADLLLPRMLAMQPHPAYPTYKTASHIMLNR
jgi:hypothetical protein